MAYMSAREMLSGLPVKMANGGDVKTYGNFGATAKDLQKAAVNVRAQIADGSYDPAAGYAEIMKSGISVDDALEAGIEPSLIDAIFTTPTALVGDQLSSQGQTSVIGSGTAFAKALTQENVDAALAKYMLDGKIDPAERLEMQKVATAQGVTFEDISSFGIDPNILYKTPAAPVDTTPADTSCPTGYTRNAVGDCQENVTVCGDGYMLNPITGNCVANNLIPNCGTGEKYNPATGQCEKIFTQVDTDTGTGADSATGVAVYNPENFGTDPTVFATGEPSLDTTFRESDPQTEFLDPDGNLTNFDYTPAASLTSATGSGFNWTPPTVTSRPRSLMSADLLARYTGGRAAADLRQLTTGLGNGRTYSDYASVLQNPGSYSGGLSKSQLYSRMRGLDYQLNAAAAADREASTARGGISAYLAANPDIAASYESQKGQLGGQSLEQFARNHYNTMGKAEMDAGKRGLFTLVESTGGGGFTIGDPNDGGGSYLGAGRSGFEGGFEGEGEDYVSPNWNSARQLGQAGGVTRPFAHGGSVKKPQGFADGGTASADLLEKTVAGIPSIARNVYNYGKDVVTAPSPSAKLLADAMGVGMKATNDPVQYGAELLGFDDARQLAIMREAVDINNQMVDANLIPPEFRVQFREAPEGSAETRENVSLDGDEEYFNTINHALFSYYAGQNPIAGLGAQIKEVKQGLQQIDRGNNPRTEYLDYFNNQFGLDLAKQGLSPAEAKNAIIDNVANIGGQGTRGRMQRGEEIKAGVDLLTNVHDAKYPWEKFAESAMAKADKLRAE
jgi:hypothetical protein